MDIDAIATDLLHALDHNVLIAPVSKGLPNFTIQSAYDVGAEITRRRRARGEQPVGLKFGFTNRAVWSKYGFPPFWAPVYDSTVTFLDDISGSVAVGHLAQPMLEPEIVLHFRRSLAVAGDEAELLSHIDWIAPGFEIVQSHFPDWRFKAPDAIAGFGVHGALIVGPPQFVSALSDPVEALRTFSVRLSRNGILQEEGGGANVLGSPLLALAALLSSTKEQPRFEPIPAGAIVATGTLTALVPVQSGETWRVEFKGIELNGLGIEIR